MRLEMELYSNESSKCMHGVVIQNANVQMIRNT